ncbi:hypothetical protein, partial [Xylanibacter rodentium]|uniref:hypothetical protein n=1 Tax=Xylanibacter rodentium TaxID=2736289 RepID=UPI0025987B66
RNFARISSSQESARINAFHYVMLPALVPSTGASCSLHLQNYKNYLITQKKFEKNFCVIFHRLPPMPRLGAEGFSILWACIMQR